MINQKILQILLDVTAFFLLNFMYFANNKNWARKFNNGHFVLN